MSFDPYGDLQQLTRDHRCAHGCGAYTFEDGNALSSIVMDRKPERVLELGTALGYTACCLASGYDQCQVDTIDLDSEHVELARTQIEFYGLSDRISVFNGEFEEVIGTLDYSYEMIFFDGYSPSHKLIIVISRLLVSNGLLVCANIPLLSDSERGLLSSELSDKSRWRSVSAIEQGKTLLFEKI